MCQVPRGRKKIQKKLKKGIDKLKSLWYNKDTMREGKPHENKKDAFERSNTYVYHF